MSTCVDRNKGTFPLSCLFPYDIATKENKQMLIALHEYSLLLTATGNAVGAMEMGHFEQFDALVGENMCQIRAIKIASMTTAFLKEAERLKGNLESVRKSVSVSIKTIEVSPKGSLNELFKKENLDVMLTTDQLFIVQSYLLTVVKVSKLSKGETPFLAHDVTDPKRLQKLGNISGSFANGLVKRLRQGLSSASVEFVRACAHALPQRESLASIVSEELIWRT